MGRRAPAKQRRPQPPTRCECRAARRPVLAEGDNRHSEISARGLPAGSCRVAFGSSQRCLRSQAGLQRFGLHARGDPLGERRRGLRDRIASIGSQYAHWIAALPSVARDDESRRHCERSEAIQCPHGTKNLHYAARSLSRYQRRVPTPHVARRASQRVPEQAAKREPAGSRLRTVGTRTCCLRAPALARSTGAPRCDRPEYWCGMSER